MNKHSLNERNSKISAVNKIRVLRIANHNNLTNFQPFLINVVHSPNKQLHQALNRFYWFFLNPALDDEHDY